ncbi:MAG TPA: hypothetical protein VNM39_13290 [Verrucomicrobiae bacterium]|nr:hypothetical protein [Verrucomicrobiae bacterium]
MKLMPLVLLAAAGGATFLLLEHHANAASPSVWPPGFTPPTASTTTTVPKTNPTNLPLKITTWGQAADGSGAQAGTWRLIQNQNNQANDWAVFFNGSPVQVGTTPTSGLIAQSAAAGQI